MKLNAFGLSLQELEGALEALGEPKYRARQVYRWLYRKRARAFSQMTNLSLNLRTKLSEAYDLGWGQVAERHRSVDGTVKYLFSLGDGTTIESVFIPEERRRTICLSTQVGCPLKCAFCLTGISGYKRNLKVSEILGQVASVIAESPEERFGWNIVLMGMGEPLLNYEQTVKALRILMDKDGFGVAPKKLTLSTVGILPALERLMEEPVRPNLAISLHAPNTSLRAELMPIEGKYPIADVMAAARRYPIPHGGRVTFEYVLLAGVNDSTRNAQELVRWLKGTKSKVNLIPLNATPEIPYGTPEAAAVDAFAQVLADAQITVSVRRPRGRDILAACGQLHLKSGASSESAVGTH